MEPREPETEQLTLNNFSFGDGFERRVDVTSESSISSAFPATSLAAVRGTLVCPLNGLPCWVYGSTQRPETGRGGGMTFDWAESEQPLAERCRRYPDPQRTVHWPIGEEGVGGIHQSDKRTAPEGRELSGDAAR